MDRWYGKVAVITGASSGIGAAIAVDLARSGLVAVGLARRVERIEAMKNKLSPDIALKLHGYRCDITKEEEILEAFAHINMKFGGIDVLINNAGVSNDATVLTGKTEEFRKIIDTNLIGMILCSREAYRSMNERSTYGHIVNINSVCGHHVLDVPRQSVYSPSKFAVTALTETIRHELRNAKTKIKVTSISPGLVRTEIIKGVPGVEQLPILEPEDIADAVRYVLSTPERVQIHELMIRPHGDLL